VIQSGFLQLSSPSFSLNIEESSAWKPQIYKGLYIFLSFFSFFYNPYFSPRRTTAGERNTPVKKVKEVKKASATLRGKRRTSNLEKRR
jgi:hypothetical protein